MTSYPALNQFLNGAIAMGCWVAGLFFVRFWRETKDRLFGFFAAAFWVLAAERVGLLYAGPDEAARGTVYLARLVGFLLIILGIVDKNRRH